MGARVAATIPPGVWSDLDPTPGFKFLRSKEGGAVCRAVKCRQCGKTTWAGCGQHVDSVKRGVPAADWCPGHQDNEPSQGGGFLGKLFGR